MDNLSQRTAEILSNKIRVEQVYMPGDKLPNENVLSEELGVSRTTLREAIRTLVSEGLLVVRRGLGTFVNETLEQYAEGALNVDDVLQMKVTLKDLYEARMIIEPAAAALAAVRASDEEIDEILRLGDVVQAEIKRHPKGDKRIQSETDFHGAIMRASHNDFLIQFIPVLTETIEKTFALDENLEIIAEDAYKDHIMIMNFLKRRDSEGLRSAVLIHLHHATYNEEL